MKTGTTWREARSLNVNGCCNPFVINGEACELRVMDKQVDWSLKKRGFFLLFSMVFLSSIFASVIAALPPY